MHCTVSARTEPAPRPGKTKARLPSGVTEQDCKAFPKAPASSRQLGSGTWR